MGKRPQARFGDKISACAGAGKVAGDTRTDGDGCVTCGCKSGSRKKSDAVNRNAVDLRRGGGSCARYGKRCRTPGQGQLPRFRSEISWVSRIWKWSACMADYRMITHRRSAFSSLCRHAAESYIMSPSKLILASPNILACPRHGVLPTIQTAS